MEDKKKQPFYKKKWFIGVIVFIAIVIIFGPDDTNTENKENKNKKISDKNKDINDEAEDSNYKLIGISESKSFHDLKKIELIDSNKSNKMNFYQFYTSHDLINFAILIQEHIKEDHFMLINSNGNSLYEFIKENNNIVVKTYDYVKWEEYDDVYSPRLPEKEKYSINIEDFSIHKYKDKINPNSLIENSPYFSSRGKSFIGRSEPNYVNTKGYLISKEFYNNPKIKTYKKIDIDHFTETKNSLDLKSKVIVKEQSLNHEGWGSYSGFLNICLLDENSQETSNCYLVNVNDFVPLDYWNDSNIRLALQYGPLIGEFNQETDIKPVNQNDEIVDIKEKTKLIITHFSNYESDSNRPIEALVKENQEDNYQKIFLNYDDINFKEN